jgi:hypothetical protein
MVSDLAIETDAAGSARRRGPQDLVNLGRRVF